MSLTAAVPAAQAAAPQVVEKVTKLQTIVQQVPEVPQVVTQIAQAAALGASMLVVGLFHELVKRDAWSDNLNRLLLAVYSVVGALIQRWAVGDLKIDTNGVTQLAIALVVALAAALVPYEQRQLQYRKLAKLQAANLPVVPLAEGSAPAQQF